MGSIERALAKKLAITKKARIKQEGIASLKFELRQEKRKHFQSKYEGLFSFAKAAGKGIKITSKGFMKLAESAAAQQRKGRTKKKKGFSLY